VGGVTSAFYAVDYRDGVTTYEVRVRVKVGVRVRVS
jgi:hypothetical protein